MKKYNKIFGVVSYPEKFTKMEEHNEIEKMIKYFNQQVVSINETMNETVLEALYSYYEKSDLERVCIISKPEFKRYLEETLPQWLKENK